MVTLNGHVVMHLAMFIASFHIDKEIYYREPSGADWQDGGRMTEPLIEVDILVRFL